MSYEKQNFTAGQVLKASHLNAMDAQIVSNKNGIKYTEQTLTDEQKAQARENIGAMGTITGEPGQVVCFDDDGNLAPMLLLEDVTVTETITGNLFDASVGYTQGYISPAGPIDLNTLEVPLDTANSAYILHNALIHLEPNTTYAVSKFTGTATLFNDVTGSRSVYITPPSTNISEGDGCYLLTTNNTAYGYYLAISFYASSTLTAYEDMVIVKGDSLPNTTNENDAFRARLNKNIKVGAEQVEGLDDIKSFYEDETIPSLVDIHDEIIYTKLISSTGAVTDYSSNNYHVTNYVNVKSMEKVVVTASTRYGNYLYAFYDSDKNFISGMISANGDTIIEIKEQEVSVPSGAVYIVAAGCNGAEFPAAVKADGDRKKKLRWSGKKWACVGDSLTEANVRATKNYHDYIAENTGIEVVNLGLSGSGYAKAGLGAPFYQRITAIPTDCDVITIFGSGNDRSAGLEIGNPADTGTTTICGCINTTLDNLFSHMINANVGLVTPTPWETSDLSDDQSSWGEYCAAIVEIARIRGIPCLDLYHCSGLRPWEESFREAFYSRDNGSGCHPDENGHALIAPRFKAFLETLIL